MSDSIDQTRRGILALAAASIAGPAVGLGAGGDAVDVALSVVDEARRPVAFPTIWFYALPRASPMAVDGADLARIASRYGESFEYATPFNRILPLMQIPPMADAGGKALVSIDYRRLEGSEHVASRSKSIGFEVMKRGYVPGRVDFRDVAGGALEATVVLKRETDATGPVAPYVEQYDRARWALSDTRSNEAISLDNLERISSLKRAMESAAASALAAGDRKTAGRIYSRLCYLPAIRVIDGKAAGFSQSDESSPEAIAYLEKAHEADPGNSYVAADRLLWRATAEFGRGSRLALETAAKKASLESFLASLDELVKVHGEHLWPRHRLAHVFWLKKSSDPADRKRVLPLLMAFLEWEPKFRERARLIELASTG